MYRISDSMMRSDQMTSYYVTQTLIAAGMIALSITVMDGLFRLFFKTQIPRTQLPDTQK